MPQIWRKSVPSVHLFGWGYYSNSVPRFIGANITVRATHSHEGADRSAGCFAPTCNDHLRPAFIAIARAARLIAVKKSAVLAYCCCRVRKPITHTQSGERVRGVFHGTRTSGDCFPHRATTDEKRIIYIANEQSARAANIVWQMRAH